MRTIPILLKETLWLLLKNSIPWKAPKKRISEDVYLSTAKMETIPPTIYLLIWLRCMFLKQIFLRRKTANEAEQEKTWKAFCGTAVNLNLEEGEKILSDGIPCFYSPRPEEEFPMV